ncbi:MAG TPA: hypothetical protein VF503_08950 [Sphingobium sp.]|uniref:hypothetical protein n=1 Tax=Sphingobium sp. TaxID=1912891 RepID=UPI002ED2EFB2
MSDIVRERSNVVALSDYRPVQPQMAAPAEHISFTLRRPKMPAFRLSDATLRMLAARSDLCIIAIGVGTVTVLSARIWIGAL